MSGGTADVPSGGRAVSARRAWLPRALATGTIASVVSTAALVSAAWAERRGAAQPLNATSHWLHGDKAAEVADADLRHTALGFATHHAATVFWAALFDLRPQRGRESGFELARNAVAMAGIAAAVDYLATPKRFTPGWELVLSKRSMAWTYLALAGGFALGAVVQSDGVGKRESAG